MPRSKSGDAGRGPSLQRARRSLSGRSFACRGDRADGQGQPPLSAPGGMQLARRSYRSYPLSTFDLWPPARLAHPDQLSQIDHRRSVPLTTMSISRPPRREHRSRSRQSSTAVRSPIPPGLLGWVWFDCEKSGRETFLPDAGQRSRAKRIEALSGTGTVMEATKSVSKR